MKKAIPTILLAIGFAGLFLLAGCVTPPSDDLWRSRLEEIVPTPAQMKPRSDLLELSDCRLAFDLTEIPQEVGLQVVDYNPFISDAKGPPKPVLCPLRPVFARVLAEGTAAMFLGGDSVNETRVILTPRHMGLSKAPGGIKTAMTIVCTIEGVQAGTFTSEKFSPLSDRIHVPAALYQAVADIGDQIMASVAASRHLRDAMLASRKGAGTMPTIVKADMGNVTDGAFTGRATIDPGTWDPARVRQWVRSQIEQIAMAKLGVKSLENYRVVLEDEKADVANASRFTVAFRAFPYQGYELDYNSRIRRGTCSADLAFLGCSPEYAYAKANRYIALVLSDQGVVVSESTNAASAEFRFNGFKLTTDGARIEIPFELVN